LLEEKALFKTLSRKTLLLRTLVRPERKRERERDRTASDFELSFKKKIGAHPDAFRGDVIADADAVASTRDSSIS